MFVTFKMQKKKKIIINKIIKYILKTCKKIYWKSFIKIHWNILPTSIFNVM